MHHPLRALFTLVAVVAFTACPEAAPDGSGSEDPCAPGGHVHRGPTPEDDSCHCDGGYVVSEDGRSCEPDAAAGTGYPFQASEADACALGQSGPFAEADATEPPAPVNALDTTYALTLRGEAGAAQGTFRYVAATTSKTLFFLGSQGAFTIDETGVGPVAIEQGPAPTHCDTFGAVWGARLHKGATYTLTFGPGAETSQRLLIRPVR